MSPIYLTIEFLKKHFIQGFKWLTFESKNTEWDNTRQDLAKGLSFLKNKIIWAFHPSTKAHVSQINLLKVLENRFKSEAVKIRFLVFGLNFPNQKFTPVSTYARQQGFLEIIK
ncbi:hypothetical protein BpHYR1_028486 [Brachionus plicatilis]|uniref:Uncharacterized protein n=1 Tax=Brachionus plicatilis TaxID=10195 RepID=A0A3M7R3N0_BRAPC|nr:hypothetical protein BpHYR1_028486 [Brachionus plicatilis]